MEKKRILFISQEIYPYVPQSEMSKIGRYLPQGIQEKGKEIRAFTPKLGIINERRNQLHEVIRLSGMNLIIDDTDHPLIIKVASIQAARMQVYFIDNEDYFRRNEKFTDEAGAPLPDNDERAIFFSRGTLETVKKLRWAPDIIHCHGWFTGFVPLYIKKAYKDDPLFANAKLVYSYYDDAFEGELDKKVMDKIKIEKIKNSDIKPLKKPDYLHVNQLAIDYSDAVIQGNEKVDPEVDQYAIQSGKPHLSYQGEDTYIDVYNEFYDEILK